MKTKLSMSIAAATLFAALSAGTIVRADEDKVEIKGLNEAKVTLAQAITSMLLPVKSSAPATITMMRPAQNTMPVRSRMTP